MPVTSTTMRTSNGKPVRRVTRSTSRGAKTRTTRASRLTDAQQDELVALYDKLNGDESAISIAMQIPLSQVQRWIKKLELDAPPADDDDIEYVEEDEDVEELDASAADEDIEEEPAPKPRRKSTKRKGGKRKGGRRRNVEISDETYATVGRMFANAKAEGIDVHEYIENLRRLVEAYDTVLG